MNKFDFNIQIAAKDHAEATSKMKSVSTLLSKLNAKELDKMADVVLHQPTKLALAKRALGL